MTTGAKPTATPDTSFTFNIPAGMLSRTLIKLGKDTHSTIVFKTNDIGDTPAPEIKGKLTLMEAIKLATQNCSCQILNTGPDSYIIQIVSKPGSKEMVTEIEEVRVQGQAVTGSHLIRKSTYNNSALVTINSDTISLTSATSLHDVLKNNPLVTGESSSTAISLGSDGSSTVSLRGLPSDATLVLVNGLRVAPKSANFQSVDLYTIPSFAADNIEIFKDGTSAIYGSDAIAGTVNINLEKYYDGIETRYVYGLTDKNDLETQVSQIKAGKEFNRYHAYVSAYYFDQSAIYSRDRQISNDANTLDNGGFDKRSWATPDSIISFADGSSIIATNNPEAPYRALASDDAYNIQQNTTSYAPATRYGAYTYHQLDFSSSLQGNLSYYYTYSESEVESAPTPVITGYSVLPAYVSMSNIYNPFGMDLPFVTRRLVELGNQKNIHQKDNHFFATNIDYITPGAVVSASYHYSESKERQQYLNIVDGYRLIRGIGPSASCQGNQFDGCTPINLLGPRGSITEEQIDYISTQTQSISTSRLSSWNIQTAFDLNEIGDQPLLIATGLEYRQEKARTRPEYDWKNSYFFGAVNTPPLEGERNIQEWYNELEYSPKLLGENTATAFELAFRYSNYSDFGENFSPRTGIRIQPFQQLTVKSSYSESFQAPSFYELSDQKFIYYSNVLDPCSYEDSVTNYPGCTQQISDYAQSVLISQQGNMNLEPELARSKTVGFLWQSSPNNTYTIGVDYFRINQTNVIHLLNPIYLVFEQAMEGESDRVTRNAEGYLEKVDTTLVNAGKRELSGYDLQLGLNFTRPKFNTYINFFATYIEQYEMGSTIDQSRGDLSGSFVDVTLGGHGALPKWKTNTSITAEFNDNRITYSHLYVDKMKEASIEKGVRGIDSWSIHNIQFQHTFTHPQVTFSLGIDNLLDTPPPYSATAFTDNYDARTHDLRGRYFYTQLSWQVN
ncbi:TonB-dependent receptor domain-containing protein [Teredinibacter sp. KSP-S5-2]|uniref:TonB-dependent receptor domain-containing protein n=1 Tax=Teredinibacter sp. KSP-S5-2 TaxID=3034506 RepID=UPI002934F3A5|nr:TonB-dependent receptor [Teredinibacter sp. KSP-S5-2]WNO08038.1 TonB-dependent receptor [Teredinibacter sp. KSP-S5-2]